MKPQEIRIDERVGANAGRRRCGETGTDGGRANPRVAGALDALVANDIPAYRREDMPFDGLDRLAYWQAKREAESNVRRPNKALARSRSVRRPGGLTHAATAEILLRRARDEFGFARRASGWVMSFNTPTGRQGRRTTRLRDRAKVQP